MEGFLKILLEKIPHKLLERFRNVYENSIINFRKNFKNRSPDISEKITPGGIHKRFPKRILVRVVDKVPDSVSARIPLKSQKNP